MPTVRMDAAWLTTNRQSGTPWYLDQAGATYVLEANIDSRGSGFAIIADNVTLDLNGNSITYDNSPVVVVRNGSFESDDRWDLSAAPDASMSDGIFIASQVWDGERGLRFDSPSGPQEVKSAESFTLMPHTTYSVSAMFAHMGGAQTTAYVNVVDSAGVTRASAQWGAPNHRGMQFREASFRTGSQSESFRVVAGVTDAAQNDVWIDDIRVQRTGAVGIVVGNFSTFPLPDVTRHGSANGAVIRNGRIIQGQDAGTQSHAIRSHSAKNVTCDDLDVYIHGSRCKGIEGYWMGGAEIQNVTFRSRVTTIASRDSWEGAVIQLKSGRVENCTIDGTCQAGVLSQRGPVVVKGNDITMHSRYTNGFGVVLWDDAGSTVEGNNINAAGMKNGRLLSGRGIQAGGGAAGSNKPGNAVTHVRDNTITVQERRNNQEYPGGGFGTYGIQIENLNHVDVEGNRVHATAEEVNAYALADNGGSNHRIVDNEFTAHNTRTHTVAYGAATEAACCRLYDQSSTTSLAFHRNRLLSNDQWFGNCSNIRDVELVDTHFHADDPIPSFRAIEVVQHPTRPYHWVNVTFRGNTYPDAKSQELLEQSPVWQDNWGQNRSVTPDPQSSFTVVGATPSPPAPVPPAPIPPEQPAPPVEPPRPEPDPPVVEPPQEPAPAPPPTEEITSMEVKAWLVKHSASLPPQGTRDDLVDATHIQAALWWIRRAESELRPV